MEKIKVVFGDKEIFLTEEQIKGNNLSLTEEQVDSLGINRKKIFERIYNRGYYYINHFCEVRPTYERGYIEDDSLYYSANYCTDKKLMKERTKDEVLSRLLWRFSIINGWDNKLWKDVIRCKYYIYYDCDNKKYMVGHCYRNKDILNIYFVSEYVAKKAIDEIIIPFKKGELPICKVLDDEVVF